ncbi:hypothetical protein GCM10027203_51680 [Nonomuraea fastidiosa]
MRSSGPGIYPPDLRISRPRAAEAGRVCRIVFPMPAYQHVVATSPNAYGIGLGDEALRSRASCARVYGCAVTWKAPSDGAGRDRRPRHHRPPRPAPGRTGVRQAESAPVIRVGKRVAAVRP